MSEALNRFADEGWRKSINASERLENGITAVFMDVLDYRFEKLFGFSSKGLRLRPNNEGWLCVNPTHSTERAIVK